MLVEGGGDHCRETTLDGGQSAHGLHLVTHRLATTAHDALVHVADDGRGNLNLIGGLGVLRSDERVLADAETHGEVLQLAIAVLGALQTVCRVVGEDQLENGSTGVDDAHGIGFHHHVGHTFGDTSGSQVATAGHFHHTNTASAGFVVHAQIVQLEMAKGRNIDTHALSGFQNSGTFRYFNFSIVYC